MAIALTRVFQVSRIPKIAVSKVILNAAIAPLTPTIATDQASFNAPLRATPASFTASNAIKPAALKTGRATLA